MADYKWKCPKCKAPAHDHGKGGKQECQDELSVAADACEGFICECDPSDWPESERDDHGTTLTNPCHNATCFHCGEFEGTFPPDPKSIKGWEKKALAAGWTPPPGRFATEDGE